MNNKLIPFHYQQTSIKEACWIDGAPYFTRRAIGEWLGYKKPQEAIDKIIKRNLHLNKPEFKNEVVLTTERQTGKGDLTPQTGVSGVDKKDIYKYTYKTDVYNLIGLQLIIFESSQPKAVQYKIAVAKLLAAQEKGWLKPATPAYQDACMTRKAAAKEFDKIMQLPYGERGKALSRLSVKTGMASKTLQAWFTEYRHMGTLDDKRCRCDGIMKRIVKEHKPRWRMIESLLNEGHKRAAVADMCGVSTSQVSRVRSRYQKHLAS